MVWFTYTVVWASYAVSNYMECESDGNMALHINDNHVVFYNMYMCRLVMLGCSPEYLIVQGHIIAMLLHPTYILLAQSNVHCFSIVFITTFPIK